MPMTSCPSRFISAAATEESTPPDMATTMRFFAPPSAAGIGLGGGMRSVAKRGCTMKLGARGPSGGTPSTTAGSAQVAAELTALAKQSASKGGLQRPGASSYVNVNG